MTIQSQLTPDGYLVNLFHGDYSALGGPALTFDFERTLALDPRITYARAGNGWRYNSAGILVQENADTPRFEYDPTTRLFKGLLVEAQRTNLVSQPSPAAGWYNAGGAPVVTNIAGPFATGPLATGYLLSGGQRGFGLGAITGSYSFSGWVQGAGNVALRRSSGSFAQMVNLSGASAANAWQYFSGSAVLDATTQYELFANNIAVAGLQVEAAAAPSSAIITAGAQVTRNADAVSFVIPANVTRLRYTFDDNSTQDVAVVAGANYTIPTNLNRRHIKRVNGWAV